MSEEPAIYREIMPEHFTRMSLTTAERHTTVTIARADLNLPALIEQLLEPLLLAAGFHPESIIEALYPDRGGGTAP